MDAEITVNGHPLDEVAVREMEYVCMVKSLLTLGWLRDLALILLLVAGNHVRSVDPAVGIMIMVCAAVIFVERFLWSWYVGHLRERREIEERRAQWGAASNDSSSDQ